MDESFVKELDSSLEVFNTYFPNERDDLDILILRGHQLAETMLYSFIRKTVSNPQHIDSFFISWEPLVSLVRALMQDDEEEYTWVWKSLIKLAKTRNQIAHNINPDIQSKHVADFINCVRSQFSGFNNVIGDDELKKAIFIVYCGLSTALALEKYPYCGATYLVRDEIHKHGQELISKGISEQST
jgi:hypothetical protein